MTSAPNRALARVVLAALALAGLLLLLTLELLILAAGRSSMLLDDLRCLLAPTSSTDTAVHAAALSAGIVAVIPLISALRAARRARATVAELQHVTQATRLHAPPAVVIAAQAAQLAGRIDVVEASRPFAFVYGWLRPRVCISSGLVAILSEKELEAVLHHERRHVAGRDPLRLLLAQVTGAAFSVVPEFRRLVRDYTLAIEVAADQHVIATMGSPRWLASALLKTMAPPMQTPAFEGVTEARVAALTGSATEEVRWRGRIALAILLLELALLIPLLRSGSLLSLAGLWVHPAC